MTNPTNHKWLIAVVLLLLMVVTRSNLLDHLQDASWAVFFIAGFYLRKSLAFAGFFLVAFAVDLVVIEWMGGQSYCFTPSYPFLIPAYAALWYAGNWLAEQAEESLRGVGLLLGSVSVGVAAAFVISNAGFYLFAGYFTEMTVVEYTSRVLHYLSGYWLLTLIYAAVATLLHLGVGRHFQSGNAHG